MVNVTTKDWKSIEKEIETLSSDAAWKIFVEANMKSGVEAVSEEIKGDANKAPAKETDAPKKPDAGKGTDSGKKTDTDKNTDSDVKTTKKPSAAAPKTTESDKSEKKAPEKSIDDA